MAGFKVRRCEICEKAFNYDDIMVADHGSDPCHPLCYHYDCYNNKKAEKINHLVMDALRQIGVQWNIGMDEGITRVPEVIGKIENLTRKIKDWIK